MRQELERRRHERLLEQTYRNRERIRAECQTLHGFIRRAWPILEPVAPFVDNWHIAAVCQHLEAISRGQLLELGLDNRLQINVPPGTMKSYTVSVFWQAWEWGPFGRPNTSFLSTSHNEHYVTRDTRRTRDLIASDWYQQLWPEVGPLVRAGETSFANRHRGSREGIPFRSLTSGRGDRVVIDDPHSTESAESDAERERVTRIFRESLPLRVNDAQRSAIVLMMQRLHPKDCCGIIDDLQLPYVKLILPMEFEPERACETPIGFRDPRTYDGELLDPVRFPRRVVERDKAVMGSYAVAGQMQQRPTPREGGMFKRAWFDGQIIRAAPRLVKIVRHWDLAATDQKKVKRDRKAARTAGVKMGLTEDGRFVVLHARVERLAGHGVRKAIKATAEADGVDVMLSLPQDPGQAGKVQREDFAKTLAGFNVRFLREGALGSKEQRAEPFSAQCEAGNVFLLEGPWNEGYLEELCGFPGGLADQVDASSGAFARLVGKRGDDRVTVEAPITVEANDAADGIDGFDDGGGVRRGYDDGDLDRDFY